MEQRDHAKPLVRNGSALLAVGGHAKFRFAAAHGGHAESMWIVVTSLAGPRGFRTIVGTLANDPVFTHEPPLAFGSVVLFPESECLATLPAEPS